MQSFLMVTIPGVLVCWLQVKNRNSWLHPFAGSELGLIASYVVGYLMSGVFFEALFEELIYVAGEPAAGNIVSDMLGVALRNAFGVISVVAVLVKLRNSRSLLSS